jgi:hypothetical protein
MIPLILVAFFVSFLVSCGYLVMPGTAILVARSASLVALLAWSVKFG